MSLFIKFFLPKILTKSERQGCWRSKEKRGETGVIEIPDITAGTNAEVIVCQNILGQVEVRLPMSDLGLMKLLSSQAWKEACHILEEYQTQDNNLCHPELIGRLGAERYKNYPRTESQNTCVRLCQRLRGFFCKGKRLCRFLNKHQLLI